jgi:hypothetical protein
MPDRCTPEYERKNVNSFTPSCQDRIRFRKTRDLYDDRRCSNANLQERESRTERSIRGLGGFAWSARRTRTRRLCQCSRYGSTKTLMATVTMPRTKNRTCKTTSTKTCISNTHRSRLTDTPIPRGSRPTTRSCQSGVHRMLPVSWCETVCLAPQSLYMALATRTCWCRLVKTCASLKTVASRSSSADKPSAKNLGRIDHDRNRRHDWKGQLTIKIIVLGS